MQFEQVFVPTDEHDIVVQNPATVLARRILSAATALEFVKIEVHSRGGKYREFGRGFSLTHDEELSESERKSVANALAAEIVEVCAQGQKDYDKPVDWKVSGYDSPDKGQPKTLFSEKFKIGALQRDPTLKETESMSLVESNKLLRLIAGDEHKKSMETASLLFKMITPISEMTGNIADKIRPSDAEMQHKTRMAEMELEATVRQAEAVGKQARNQSTNETLRYLIDQMPMDDIGESAKLYAQHLIETQRAKEAEEKRKAEESRRKQSTESPPPPEPDVSPSEATQQPPPPDRSHLCEGSRVLAEIIDGRHDALAAGLGDDWSRFKGLAEQSSQDEFDRLAKDAYKDFSSRPKMQLMTLFTKMNVALADGDDSPRMDRLQAFLKESGIMRD
ncbi:MAG: hypothetical protein ACRBN8_24110 [Nannocystales bacterium]